jgi:hypothetical protein
METELPYKASLPIVQDMLGDTGSRRTWDYGDRQIPILQPRFGSSRLVQAQP